MMRALPEAPPEEAWATMRGRHVHGDDQIHMLWRAQRELAETTDDMAFVAADLAPIRARTLVVYGARDPLYPVETGVALYRAIPSASLWVVPGGGHAPVFLDASRAFADAAVAFLSA